MAGFDIPPSFWEHFVLPLAARLYADAPQFGVSHAVLTAVNALRADPMITFTGEGAVVFGGEPRTKEATMTAIDVVTVNPDGSVNARGTSRPKIRG